MTNFCYNCNQHDYESNLVRTDGQFLCKDCYRVKVCEETKDKNMDKSTFNYIVAQLIQAHKCIEQSEERIIAHWRMPMESHPEYNVYVKIEISKKENEDE